MTVPSPPAVSSERIGNVLVARIDNPPVNALSRAVRAGLMDALHRLETDENVAGLVIAAGGRMFSAGADIDEFNGEIQQPFLGDVTDRLEQSSKPVIAAIHGTALGGGLEVALACHHRIAASGTVFGLPEVRLGTLPGSGGIVRLPRLVGIDQALAMIAEGRRIGAEEALSAGLIDRVASGDLMEECVALFDEIAGAAPPRTGDRPFPAFNAEREAAARTALAKKYRGQEAPQKAVDLLAMAARTPMSEALRLEHETCRALLSTAQSRALRHLFKAEREAGKIADVAEDAAARSIDRVGIVGTGTMGRGIAITCLDAGFEVVLIGRSGESADLAREAIANIYASTVRRGRLNEQDVADRLARLETSHSLDRLVETDLVIETISEDIDAKRAVISAIDAIVPDHTIMVTNTSFLDIEQLARATKRPANFAGMHFFNPANVMKLVENIRTEAASDDVLVTLMAFAKRLGKTAVMVGPSDGFVANRMLSKRTREALFLLQEGATPHQIDRVLTEFGFPVGPLALADMAGLDVLAATRRARAATMSKREREADIIERLVVAGRLGQKSGAGYYAYGEGRKPQPDPEVETLLAAHRAERGVGARTISDDEVRERCIFAIINEGARLLEEGVVARPGDIDVLWTKGLGFPAHLGGPMHYAEEIGLPHVRTALAGYAATIGDEYFKPARLIEQRADGSGRFA